MILPFGLSLAGGRVYPSEPSQNEAFWQDQLNRLAQKSYEIQKGDTLWELSRIFFGDPNYWSKIWALNRDIWFNPHEIQVGDELIFDLGAVNRPPAVRWFRKQDQEWIELKLSAGGLQSPQSESLPLSTSPSSSATVSNQQVGAAPVLNQQEDDFLSPLRRLMKRKKMTISYGTLPEVLPPEPPMGYVPPFLRQLPPSFPRWESVLPDSLIKMDLSDRPDARGFRKAVIEVTCWAQPISSAQTLPEVARIDAVFDAMHAAHENQKIYLKANGELDSGQVLAILDQGFLDRQAFLIKVLGWVRVQQKVQDNIWQGVIFRIFESVGVGAKLYDIPMRTAELTLEAPEQQYLEPIYARVISGRCDAQNRLLGYWEYVFLKAETSVNVEPGQWIRVHLNQRRRGLPSRVDQNTPPAAVAQVVSVEDPWITAVIVKSLWEVIPEDRAYP